MSFLLLVGLFLWCLWLLVPLEAFPNDNVHRRLLLVAQAVGTGRAHQKADQTGALGLLDELLAGNGDRFDRLHVAALTHYFLDSKRRLFIIPSRRLIAAVEKHITVIVTRARLRTGCMAGKAFGIEVDLDLL